MYIFTITALEILIIATAMIALSALYLQKYPNLSNGTF